MAVKLTLDVGLPDVSLVKNGKYFLAFHCQRYQFVFSWADIAFPNPRSFATIPGFEH